VRYAAGAPLDARARTADARAFTRRDPACRVNSWTAAPRRKNTAMSVIAAEQVARVYHREAGTGNAVVCLHASASSSAQWRPLMDRLAGRFRTLAADLYGSGRSPAWPGERPLCLADEVALLEPGVGGAGPAGSLVRPSLRG